MHRNRIFCESKDGFGDISWYCNTGEWCSGPTSKIYAIKGIKDMCKTGQT